jgi:hypothetical protein
MLVFELFKCKSCGLETRRKRLAQRYCSERCRNSAAQNRKRRKQSRSGDSKRVGSPKNPKIAPLLPLYLEAVTRPLKPPMETMASESKKLDPYPPSPEGLAKSLRRPVVNLTGSELPPGMMSRIVSIETANYPPLLAPPTKFSVAA